MGERGKGEEFWVWLGDQGGGWSLVSLGGRNSGVELHCKARNVGWFSGGGSISGSSGLMWWYYLLPGVGV